MSGVELLAAWRDLVPGADAEGEALLARWGEAHRRYHDREHLAEVLAAVGELETSARDAGVVRLAAWFHDAVYVGRPGEDEEASAVLAEQMLGRLGLEPGRVAAVARLVRMTASHRPPDGDPDADVLSDADLWILAAPPERYARYAAAVRAEYAHVPDAAFRAGRAAVLVALTDGPWIYRTPRARTLWERGARVNVAGEIGRLHEVPPPRE